MAIRELGEMTFEDVSAMDRSRTIAVLPVGAIEAHGPHLPLATDTVIAAAMARAGAAALDAAGWHAVLLPPLPFTAAPFAAAFPGTLSVAPGTVTALLADLAAELARQGFAALAIANAHLDPTHLAALRAGAERARTAHAMPVVFPELSRKPWALRLTEEFRTGACHAGRFEGSVVMAERPDLVRESIRVTLDPNPASLSQAIRDGKKSFEEAGGPAAYFGFPQGATAEEGRETLSVLGEILADALEAGAEKNQATGEKA